MAQQAFDYLKQIIDDRTNNLTPGLVSNLQGVIDGTITVETADAAQGWFALTTMYPRHPTYREFVDAHSNQRLPYAEASGQGGTTQYPAAGGIMANTATMLFTKVSLSGPQTVPVRAVAPGHTISVYRDGLIAVSGMGEVSGDIPLSAGVHYLAILASGGTNPIRVELPEALVTAREEPTPPAPLLAGQPVNSYLKASNGSYVVNVSWFNEASASAWQVYRSESVEIGDIVEAEDTDTRRVTVRILGTALNVQPGTFVFTPQFFAGRVAIVAEQENGLGQQTTVIVIDTAEDVPAATTWLGAPLIQPTGDFQSRTRITYSGAPVLTYQDTSVTQGQAYLYRVTAFGFITGTAESDFSEPGWVLVRDAEAPGDIIFDPLDATIINGQLNLPFVAPSDDDYAGLMLFFEDGEEMVHVTTELGLRNAADALIASLPRAGTYWLRTFDTSGNVQETGLSWEWDGDRGSPRAARGKLLVIANGDGTADLELTASGSPDAFPGTLRALRHTLTSPLVLKDGETTATLTSEGTLTKATHPGLGAIPLNEGIPTRFWLEITDASGRVEYETAIVDSADDRPGGVVTVENYLAFPVFTLLYDDDVETIHLDVPDAAGAPYGRVTFSRDDATLEEGGGEVTYIVGATVVKRLSDDAIVAEASLPGGGSRGPYTVTYVAASGSAVMWKGTLYGRSAATPVLDVGYAVDQMNTGVVDFTVKITSPVGEDVTLEFKADDDLSIPVWSLVPGSGQTAPYYRPSGTTIPSTATFHSAGVWAQSLDNVPLIKDQVKRVAMRAVSKSGITAPWTIIALPFKELPLTQAVDLVWDESDDKLYLRATAGAFTQSARFEISDDPTFASPDVLVDFTMTPGQSAQTSLALTGTGRNKRWYGRVTPHNGPLTGGVVTGLGGIGVQDSEFVPDLVDVNLPSGTVTLSVDAAGVPTLLVGAVTAALSFVYKTSKTGTPTTPSGGTTVNFNGSASISTTLPTLAIGEHLYVTVWFYSAASAGGTVGVPVNDHVHYVPSAPPTIHSVLQTRVPAADIRLDIQVRVTDPLNRGGTLYTWTNLAVGADPNSTAPNGTYTVASTPQTFTPGQLATLGNILGDATQDRYVYVEFINVHGQSTGKHRIKLDIKASDLRLTATQITVNRLDEFSKDMGIQVNAKLVGYQTGYFLNLNAGKAPADMSGGGVTDPDPDNNWFIKSPEFSVDKNGNAFFSGSITVGTLADLNNNLGFVYAGIIHNSHTDVSEAYIDLRTNSAGGPYIFYSPSFKVTRTGAAIMSAMIGGYWHNDVSGALEAYIDLRGALGSGYLLYSPNVKLWHDGSALFGGEVRIDSETATDKVSFYSSGIEYATLYGVSIAGYDTVALKLAATSDDGLYIRRSQLNASSIMDLRASEVTLTTAALHIIDNFSSMKWSLGIGKSVNGHPYDNALGFSPFGGGTGASKFWFTTDGRGYANTSWLTFSPKPPKPAAEMNATDWLLWGAEDAKKPVKPYEGMPSPDNPEVKALAKQKKKKLADVVQEEHDKYAKDIAKIAIGTARWSDLVHEALTEANSFADFKRRLGL